MRVNATVKYVFLERSYDLRCTLARPKCGFLSAILFPSIFLTFDYNRLVCMRFNYMNKGMLRFSQTNLIPSAKQAKKYECSVLFATWKAETLRW